MNIGRRMMNFKLNTTIYSVNKKNNRISTRIEPWTVDSGPLTSQLRLRSATDLLINQSL